MNRHSEDAAPASDTDRIEREATEWLARRDRGLSAHEVEALARWEAADPRHVAAIEELGSMWAALDDLAALEPSAVPSRATPSVAAAPAPIGASTRLRRWWRPVLAAAAAILVVLGSAVWLRSARAVVPTTRYETGLGERRLVVLDDGSRMQLDTDSAVAVRFAPAQRGIQLERGQAYFAVAHNPARPFVVNAAGIESRAVGTAFVVARRAGAVELLVTEGRVRFGAAGATSAADVSAGQDAVLATTAMAVPTIVRLTPETLAARLAWQEGRLEFNHTPLAEALAEFQRYHRVRLEVRDPATAAIRVNGGFRSDNLEGFLRQIEVANQVVAERRDDGTIVLGVKR